MKGFLYGQTEYNLLSNTLRLKSYIQKAKEYEYSFLSITDCNMFGYYKFYNMCIDNDIKPIIGLEINVESSDSYKNTLIAYAINDNGLSNLFKITTYLKINEIISFDTLSLYNDGLVFITTGMSFIVDRYCFNQEYDKAFNCLSECRKILGNIAIGYMGQDSDYAKHSLDVFNYFSSDFIFYPLWKTLYLNEEDYKVFEVFSNISSSNQTSRKNHHMPNIYEIEYSFGSEVLFNNLSDLVNKVNYNLSNRVIHMPKYPNTNGLSSLDFLKNLCYNGLEKRILMDKSINKSIYLERLDFEINVINQMQYCDYFLIVWDFVKYAKNNKIMVGPGRGSAAGSLVSFCLGITSVDPIKYNLLFERFLNPQRISMPDIDMDFPDNKRDEVISYVQSVYGKLHVCNITAFGTFQLKSSIRDIARILKIDASRVNEIVKLAIDNDFDTLLEMFSHKEDIYNLIYIAKSIEGLPRHISTHAAGIILSSERLDNIIPLQTGLNGLYQSQLEAHDLEDMGLLKIDFLGIKNLSLINDIALQTNYLNNINIYKLPLDDKATFALLQNADTLGIFQLESSGIKNVLRKLKPTNFEDIVAVLALYRPGPMDSIDEFIARKHGKAYNYLHNDLIPILSSTYGIIIYQEQIMNIALKFANYSLAQADLLRRAVSKKQESILIDERGKFVKSSIENGYKESDANLIYDYIVKFANYGFNRSHSVSYAMVSYIMTYLKANHFAVFIQKLLDNVIGSVANTCEYIDYAILNNVSILPPDINISEDKYCLYNNQIYMPFTCIHGVGSSICNQIVSERYNNGDFTSFDDFKKRLNIGVKTRELLIYAGCFDLLNSSKKQLIDDADDDLSLIDKFLQDLKEVDDYDESYLRQMEFNMLGINLKYDLFKDIDLLNNKYNTQLLKGHKIGDNVKFIACFNDFKVIKTKKNDDMLLGSIKHIKSVVNIVIFPSEYNKIKTPISYNGLYVIHGKISKNKQNKVQIEIFNISKI